MATLRPDSGWTADTINALPIEKNFRMRGIETTRLDTLVDAAFAFALSMLVIAQDSVPRSFNEFISGFEKIPALIVSFAVLMMFWFSHRKWSRRYGVESTFTVVASVSLIFVLLVYIYPLRLIFEGMFSSLTGGTLEWELTFTSTAQVRGFFAFYSCGFLAMTSIMGALYYSVLHKKSDLLLDTYEIAETEKHLNTWRVAVGFSILSIVIAITAPFFLVPMAGFIFFGFTLFDVIYSTVHKKRLAKILAAGGT